MKAGYFDGQTLDPVGVAKVADLPSKEEFVVASAYAQAAPRQVLGVVRGPARDLLYLLKNYEDNRRRRRRGIVPAQPRAAIRITASSATIYLLSF